MEMESKGRTGNNMRRKQPSRMDDQGQEGKELSGTEHEESRGKGIKRKEEVRK